MDEITGTLMQLVRVCKIHQRNSLALSTVVTAIMRENSQGRASLSQNRVQEMIAAADQNANQIVATEFARLEQAILDGTDCLPALREYLDRNL